jgi:hypothetical protein
MHVVLLRDVMLIAADLFEWRSQSIVHSTTQYQRLQMLTRLAVLKWLSRRRLALEQGQFVSIQKFP